MSLTKSKTSAKRKSRAAPRESGPCLFSSPVAGHRKAAGQAGQTGARGADIYQRFVSDIEPLEREQCGLIFQLCQRLAGFTARKSFTQWQREMLHGWIDELMGYLESNPFRGAGSGVTLYGGASGQRQPAR